MLTINHLFAPIFFQMLQFITNTSIKYQSFVYTQLNDQTDLFQTIQFSTSQES